MESNQIKWKPEMSIGIEKIDEQHKHFVKLLNDLDVGAKAGQGNEMIAGTIKKLSAYALEHFKLEESLFVKYGYSGAKEHIREHKIFTRKVLELYRDFSSGKGVLIYDVIDFIKSWITSHIRDVDMKYAPYLIQRAAKEEKGGEIIFE